MGYVINVFNVKKDIRSQIKINIKIVGNLKINPNLKVITTFIYQTMNPLFQTPSDWRGRQFFYDAPLGRTPVYFGTPYCKCVASAECSVNACPPWDVQLMCDLRGMLSECVTCDCAMNA